MMRLARVATACALTGIVLYRGSRPMNNVFTFAVATTFTC